MIETRAVPINIEDEIRKSYLEYALSVIIGRALPDVRDVLVTFEPGGGITFDNRWRCWMSLPQFLVAKSI
jgi:hypothetical protein